ncbi:hypothetical protein TNCV_605981 [Trichonephila clavipes]|nr:hypothetical protein TNCV_605981 [Trichonephila clavipes]
MNLQSYLVKIFQGYLQNRTFQIKINTKYSRVGHILAGAPEGSILTHSPILYNLLTHDFTTFPTVDICLLADATAIITQSTTPERIAKNLRKYVANLRGWLTLWSLHQYLKTTCKNFHEGKLQEQSDPSQAFSQPNPMDRRETTYPSQAPLQKIKAQPKKKMTNLPTIPSPNNN